MIPVFIAIDSIDHEQIFIFDKAIKIRVVYCPAGFGGNERVLSPCNPDVKGFSVVAQDVLKKSQCPGTTDDESAHVRDVKKPGPLAGSQMLVHDAGGIENRHLPAAKFHHLRARGHVLVVYNGSFKFAH